MAPCLPTGQGSRLLGLTFKARHNLLNPQGTLYCRRADPHCSSSTSIPSASSELSLDGPSWFNDLSHIQGTEYIQLKPSTTTPTRTNYCFPGVIWGRGAAFFLTEILFPRHKVHHFKVYNVTLCSIFLSPLSNFRTFPSPQKETLSPLTVTPYFPSPQPLGFTHLFSVSVTLSILNISYEWNPTLCGLLCLASLGQHHVFEVHSRCVSTSLLLIAA